MTDSVEFQQPAKNTLSIAKISLMIILYGISNCDTIRKARRWLDENNLAYQFHDFRKDGINQSQLETWVAKLGWEALLNKRSTTWRSLSDTQKQSLNRESALSIMLENPTIIKRPILEIDQNYMVGFSIKNYQQLLT